MNNETIQTGASTTPENQSSDGKQSIKINKKTAIIIAAVIALGVLAYFLRGFFVAAIVDGVPISRLSVILKLEKSSGKNLLDSLITEKLIQNEAKAKNITVSDDEINAEIKKIEDQITAQGGTLNAALAAQGMSLDDLRSEIVIQKDLEKLVADKTSVTDEEVAQYIKDNQISIPAGQEATTTEKIKSGLIGQKISQEGDALITALKAKAKINYFVNY
jgi:foldase protein PrsA